MDGALPGPVAFLPISLGRAGLRLRLLRPFQPRAPLRLYCRGIEVGRLDLDRAIEPGSEIDIPVRRLPLVPLPAELRLSDAVDGPDLAPPWRIETRAAALMLLGVPAVVVEDLRLDHGVLRGTGREATNGLLDPVLYARVNGSSGRLVVVDAPVALPEGGCAFRFALPIQPADLMDTGLSVEVHLVGQDAPLAAFGWTRAGAGETERLLAQLDGRLRLAEQAATAARREVLDLLDRHARLQQDRIDAFVEAAATLLLDRLAGMPGGERDALRGLLDTVAPAAAVAALPDPEEPHVVILPDGLQFGAGWHAVESGPTGTFRWMGASGAILNPAPERPATGVTLVVSQLYGTSLPAVDATLDGHPATVAIDGTGEAGFGIRISPAAGPAHFALVRVTSRGSGIPVRDGVSADDRELSLAITRVVFTYAT